MESFNISIDISFFFAAMHSRSIIILLPCYTSIYLRTLYLSILS
jgi:hypothetical protein